ncbi:MAG: lytic murein transglycosylase [Rubellimicrobium sp.]|nr:lytic murein transglycosylase [Rubellimicrobium sp.]
MRETRRGVLAGMGAALTLAACGRRMPAAASGASGAPVAGGALPVEPNPGWDAWVASFRSRALAQGIAPATFDAAFSAAGFTPGVVERDRNQTETRRSLEDYLALTAGEERVAEGRAKLAQHGATLAAIEARYGVPAHVTCAVWGIESRYGTRLGGIPVISATSTLAFDGRRATFYENQCLAALRILQAGDTTPARMTGSWAGAMGHTQFIPTTYLAHAVDFTGDGRRDIWGADPTDALASAGAYLAQMGWQRGQVWGLEVEAGGTPEGTRDAAQWAALGVRAAQGQMPGAGLATLIRPQGDGGPAFLVLRNFGVIGRYNNAQNYKLAVGYLSDRLRGFGPLRAGFGADANGLTQADRIRLQARLSAAGFDTGGADGVLGPKSIAAIEGYERAHGLPVTGRATPALLARLG